MWFPYDHENNDILFWMTGFYQFFITTSICGAITVLEMFPVFFMAYIVGMLEQLCEMLEELNKTELPISKEDTGSKVIDSSMKLLECVSYQLKIWEITKKN